MTEDAVLKIMGHNVKALDILDFINKQIESFKSPFTDNKSKIQTLAFLAYAEGLKMGITLENEKFRAALERYADQKEGQMQDIILKYIQPKGEA